MEGGRAEHFIEKQLTVLHTEQRYNKLYIFSSLKIALILFLRNKMKSHMKISYFDFHLL